MKSVRISIGIATAILGALALGCAGKPARTWQNDYAVFLNHLRQSAEVSKMTNNGQVSLELLNKEYAGQAVSWSGTLRYVRRGRPYFDESFLTVDKGSKMAAVIYHVEPADVGLWELLSKGSVVEYTGIVEGVYLEKSADPDGFVYIELTKVRPVLKEGAEEE